MALSISFITMGCAKNEVDSDRMAALLQDAGYRIEDDPLSADAVVVNTCSFIEAATEESIDAILEAAGYPNIAEGRAKLVVAGCLPSRYGKEAQEELCEVSAFVPCAQEDGIVAEIDAVLGVKRARGNSGSIAAGALPARLQAPLSAYVKISDGCDRYCSFCTIPSIRGRYRSFPFAQIESEVAHLVEGGTREIVLIGQDTGRWGADFEKPQTLAMLLEGLAQRFPDTWFRLMYLQPEGVTGELLDVLSSKPNVCKYLDIPFQHAAEGVLGRMNRTGSFSSYIELVRHIRSAVQGIALRTTLMVGFPGETEDDFDSLCDFVEEAALDYVGIFAYSREDGTRAARLDGQVPEGDKLDRLQRLRDVADAVSYGVVAERIGSTSDILVCGVEEDGQLYGRSMAQAPDVDGVTYVDGGALGQIAPYVIEDTLLYEMEGRACQS
jgi:ribosomal protein S12 methylthiotransferase